MGCDFDDPLQNSSSGIESDCSDCELELLSVNEVIEVLSNFYRKIITFEDLFRMVEANAESQTATFQVSYKMDRYIVSAFACHVCGELVNDYASMQIHLHSCSGNMGNVECTLEAICKMNLVHFHYIGKENLFVCTACNLTVTEKNLDNHRNKH